MRAPCARLDISASSTPTPALTKLHAAPLRVVRPPQDGVIMCVYGSLMSGLPNHHLLETSRYVGDCATEAAYAMYDMGNMRSYPAVCVRGRTAIRGALYEVDAVALEDIDRLEGHPRQYKREPIVLLDPPGQQAWMYILPRKNLAWGSKLVPGGDWRAHLRGGSGAIAPTVWDAGSR